MDKQQKGYGQTDKQQTEKKDLGLNKDKSQVDKDIKPEQPIDKDKQGRRL